MNTPSPWILLIGGGALLNVSLMVGGSKAPAWARYGGMGVCIALGLTCIVLALRLYFKKKPERAKFVPKKKAVVELLPETAVKTGARRKPKARISEPPPPGAA
jgi:hypothetical protein